MYVERETDQLTTFIVYVKGFWINQKATWVCESLVTLLPFIVGFQPIYLYCLCFSRNQLSLFLIMVYSESIHLLLNL